MIKRRLSREYFNYVDYVDKLTNANANCHTLFPKAEKLTILNDRGIGMLTRLYNIKKVIVAGDSPVPLAQI